MSGGASFKDLTNKIFGRLTAISVASKVKYRSCTRTKWLCRCICGKTAIVDISKLTTGHTKSCGCLYGFITELSMLKKVFCMYKYHARRRSLSFELTLDECLLVFKANCFYCNALPSNTSIQQRPSKRAGSVTALYSGIDRVDSSKGYNKDNVVPCCIRCNVAKNDMPVQEFISLCHKVAQLHPLSQ